MSRFACVQSPAAALPLPGARHTWAEKGEYDAQARRLVSMFAENFQKFDAHVEPDVMLTAPALRAAE